MKLGGQDGGEGKGSNLKGMYWQLLARCMYLCLWIALIAFSFIQVKVSGWVKMLADSTGTILSIVGILLFLLIQTIYDVVQLMERIQKEKNKVLELVLETERKGLAGLKESWKKKPLFYRAAMAGIVLILAAGIVLCLIEIAVSGKMPYPESAKDAPYFILDEVEHIRQEEKKDSPSEESENTFRKKSTLAAPVQYYLYERGIPEDSKTGESIIIYEEYSELLTPGMARELAAALETDMLAGDFYGDDFEMEDFDMYTISDSGLIVVKENKVMKVTCFLPGTIEEKQGYMKKIITVLKDKL